MSLPRGYAGYLVVRIKSICPLPRRSLDHALGGTLASIPGIAWGAKLKPDGAKCKRNKQCASGQCVDRVCGGGACAVCPEPCVCETDLRTGDQACIGAEVRVEPRCNACIEGEVCVASSNPGEVGCVATCATPRCVDDSDCDDFNECTADVCLDGRCVHTPIEC
jgi:Dictyostelium (slime mold) repeat